MPILDLNDSDDVYIGELAPKEEDTIKYRTNNELGTSTLFSKEKPLDTIMKYVSGMKWEIDYFLNVVGVNEKPEPLDVNVPSTVQRYHRINNLIITLNSGINQDNIDNISGDGVINANITPRVTDMFLATLTQGRLALFTITEVELQHYNLHDCYKISFKLFSFVDSDSNLYNNLIYKTVKTYKYDKDHIYTFSAPIILEEDYKKKINLKNRWKEIVEYYFNHFVNEKRLVVSLPTDDGEVYIDNLLTRFIFSIINHEDSEMIYKINRLDENRNNDVRLCLWDMILERDYSMLKRLQTNIGFRYLPYNYDSVIARQYHYLGIRFGVCLLRDNERPYNGKFKDISTRNNFFKESEIYIENNPTTDIVLDSTNGTIEGIDGNYEELSIPTLEIEDNNQTSIKMSGDENTDIYIRDNEALLKPVEGYYKPIGDGNEYTYVLSNHFYLGNMKDCGILERSLTIYLQGKTIPNEELEIMLSQYHMWSTIDQFYGIPILLVLLRDSINHTFKSI